MFLQESLKQRYEEQANKLELLLDVKLNFVEFSLDCKDLKAEMGIELEKYNIKPNLPVVYFFEIIDGNNGLIWDALNAFKNNKSRSCPKITKAGQKNNTTTLYVGSVKWAFQNRLRQHFGYGHPGTFSLQLYFWAKAIDLKLKIHYCILEPFQIPVLRDIEAAVSQYLNPLVGKREQ
jgi:hypothetical protein